MTTAPLTASSQTNVRGRKHGVQAATPSPPPPQPPAPLDYAAAPAARKAAIIKVDNTYNNGWPEVNLIRKPKSERDYASFRVGVTLSNFEKLCDPEIWPVNVEYSEWIWFRPNTNPNQPEVK